MIKEREYKKRRDFLAKRLSNNSFFIVSSAKYKTRSNDTDYPYRQDSDFYYLTGFKEDNAHLILIKKNSHTKSILFVQKKDKVDELWNGKRIGKVKAKKRFSVDKVILNNKFKKIKKKISSDLKLDKNGLKIISKMRLIKSSSEIELISKAIDITKEAHHKAMRFNKVDKYEYELQAELEYIFKKKGAYSDAYSSIVASGNNANTLHYVTNKKLLKKGDLVLIDAGCEYDYYASDITRTIPVDGKFTKAQKELYSLVLNTQLKIIRMIKPRVLRSKLQKKAEVLLIKGMIKLGILEGDYKKLLKKKRHKKYYPHGIGHWMGLDVHDKAPYKNKYDEEIPLKKGMVLTIEPGIYISKYDKKVPKKYRGIGIRIEDNILVTKSGYKNLSSKIVKSIKEIEDISYSYNSIP